MSKVNVAVLAEYNKKLDALVKHRKESGSFVNTKTRVVAELIEKAHKREVKEIKDDEK